LNQQLKIKNLSKINYPTNINFPTKINSTTNINYPTQAKEAWMGHLVDSYPSCDFYRGYRRFL